MKTSLTAMAREKPVNVC